QSHTAAPWTHCNPGALGLRPHGLWFVTRPEAQASVPAHTHTTSTHPHTHTHTHTRHTHTHEHLSPDSNAPELWFVTRPEAQASVPGLKRSRKHHLTLLEPKKQPKARQLFFFTNPIKS